MSFIIGLLTVLLVLDCLILVLLVMVQLPKKDAGAGLAFGGGAADTLFGAGSGNVLTKTTKYAAIIFFVLTIIVAMLNTRVRDHSSRLRITTPEAPAVLPQPAAPVIPQQTAPATMPSANVPQTATPASTPVPTTPAPAQP